MEIDILTLFPGMFAPLDESMVGRAQGRGILDLRLWNIRDYASDRHRTTDDTPYGGGGGMVMKPEPVFKAVAAATRSSSTPLDRILLMSPQGRKFEQADAEAMARDKRLLFICGHYEGVDERVRSLLVTDELSIGDYVLTGGELPAMVIVDAVVRLLPGVLGNAGGAAEDSFATGLLEHPHYTRPFTFQGIEVPEVLVSGNHEKIRIWRRMKSLKRTAERRPDLLAKAHLNAEDWELLESLGIKRSDLPHSP